MNAYLDTSVLAAYYCPEPLSGAAERAIRKLDQPVISPLVEVELHSAVAIKLRTRTVDVTGATRILSQFRLHIAQGFYRQVAIQAREYELARDWIAQFTTSLRTSDGLHLAAAFAHGLVLFTTDGRLAQAATRLGVTHKLLAKRRKRCGASSTGRPAASSASTHRRDLALAACS